MCATAGDALVGEERRQHPAGHAGAQGKGGVCAWDVSELVTGVRSLQVLTDVSELVTGVGILQALDSSDFIAGTQGTRRLLPQKYGARERQRCAC